MGKYSIEIDDKVFEEYTLQRLNDLIEDTCMYLSLGFPFEGDNPFEISLKIDKGKESEFTGRYLKTDIRKEFLEYYINDHDYYREKIKATSKAFKDFARELDELI